MSGRRYTRADNGPLWAVSDGARRGRCARADHGWAANESQRINAVVHDTIIAADLVGIDFIIPRRPVATLMIVSSVIKTVRNNDKQFL